MAEPHCTSVAISSHQNLRCRTRCLIRRGVTLIELMVAIALTLLVVMAVVRIFDLLGTNVTASRSLLELSGRLRTAAAQLQSDLEHLTVKPVPPADPLAAPGYFEIIEGIRSDRDVDGDGVLNVYLDGSGNAQVDSVANPFVVLPTREQVNAPTVTSVDGSDRYDPNRVAIIDQNYLNQIRGVLGDTDDVWMGTIHSTGAPFRGRFTDPILKRTIVVESKWAEVVWWVQPTPGPIGSPSNAFGLTLMRRVLLIRPDLTDPRIKPNAVPLGVGNDKEIRERLADNDISMRIEITPIGTALVANSLSDLSQRHNRFAHWPNNAVVLVSLADYRARLALHLLNRKFLVPASDRSDRLTNDVLAFDLRVYDPLAPVFQSTPTTPYVLNPTDPGYYRLVGNATPVGFGAYVDLGYLDTFLKRPQPLLSQRAFDFAAYPATRSRVMGTPWDFYAPRVYCTWSTSYERDGLNQDADTDAAPNQIDEGTDGLHTPPGYEQELVPDDLDEQETAPPYSSPLRGVEVLLRLSELNSQQMRQVSVVADFVTH